MKRSVVETDGLEREPLACRYSLHPQTIPGASAEGNKILVHDCVDLTNPALGYELVGFRVRRWVRVHQICRHTHRHLKRGRSEDVTALKPMIYSRQVG